jgi:hypothetical protein
MELLKKTAEDRAIRRVPAGKKPRIELRLCPHRPGFKSNRIRSGQRIATP